MTEQDLSKTIKTSESMSTDQLLQNFSQNLDLSPTHREKLARIAQEIRASKNVRILNQNSIQKSELSPIRVSASTNNAAKREYLQSLSSQKKKKKMVQKNEPSPIISASRVENQQFSPYRIENSMMSSSMEYYVSHLKNLTSDQLTKVNSDDVDNATGRPKSVEKYIQKAMERRDRVKQNSIRTSAIDPGSCTEVSTIGRIQNISANPIPIVSASVQESTPSLAYKLRLQQNDPLLKLHLPQNTDSCPTVVAAQRVLAHHREWMEERREQRETEEKKMPKKYKIDDVNDLQLPHSEDCYIYQQARGIVSTANELERAKMFRINQNSSSSSPPTISASSYLAGIRNNSTYIPRQSTASQLENQGVASLLAAREGLTPFSPHISSPSANNDVLEENDQESYMRQKIIELTPSRRLLQASSTNLQEITEGQAKSQEGSYDIDPNQLKYFSGKYSQILNAFNQIVTQLQDTIQNDLSKIKQPLEEFKRLSTVKIYPKNVIRYINQTFIKIEKPPKGTKRKIWNYLKATVIYMVEKLKSNRVSNSTNSNRSLSKRHAARVMRQIKRGQSGGQRRSLLSESTLSKDQSSINQNMFQSLTPAQQQMLIRHRHNFVMDVKPKSSKLQQNKKKRMKFSEYEKQQSGNYGGSLEDNSNEGSGFGYSNSQFFTGHRSSGGRISSLNFQPRTAVPGLNIQGLNATSEDSLSLSNANVQQQFAPVVGKKQDIKGSPKILEPRFIGQTKQNQSKRRSKPREQFEGTQIQTAGWADSQQSPQIETPQSLLKTRGSIFKNQDVYLYKDNKQQSDKKKNYLVVELKQDKTQQRSPTAQLINLKTARAQAKRQLSKIGAMEDYNVVPVTKMVQAKDKRGGGTKSSSRISSPTQKMIKKLKKYSPLRGENLMKSLKEIQQLESPKPRRSSSVHKRSVRNSSQGKMKRITEQSEATPPNQLENRNLVQEFKAVANPQISEQEKIELLIAQNNKYLQDAQREENQIKLKLEQKFSQIKEEILEYENSPEKAKKVQQQKGEEEKQESEVFIQLKQTAPLMSENRGREAIPLYDSKEKKKTLHLIEDPIFQPAKDILDEDGYKTSYISKKIEQQRQQTEQSNKGKSQMFLQCPETLKVDQLQVSDDYFQKRSDISAVQIEVTRPRSASPKNFLLMQGQEMLPQQNFPKKLQSQEKSPENEISQKQEKQQEDAKNQTRIWSPRTQKINQYKRIIQINQSQPETPPFEERLRYQRILNSNQEVFEQRRVSTSSSTTNIRQQATQNIIQRIRSARIARNQVKSSQPTLTAVYYNSDALNESKFERSKTPVLREERLDPDLQQSLRQISRKSIILKDADIIKNQYQVQEQKHLQELEKTLCARQPQADQAEELQTSQASNTNNNNLKDSVLTINQLSMQKQTPTSAAYYYKRHMNPANVKSDTADPTASFGVGASRISDQVSNMPRKMVSGDTFTSGQQDLSIAQQNLQLRSAFKETLKGGSGDKRRLTQEISQACYKEVEKLIQQERRQDQLRGMRRKSKYVEVKSKVKDYIEGRSFSRQYQKISDISAITNTESSIRKTPAHESASNKGSSNNATQSFLLQRSKSPKIVRQFHLSSTAAISSPNSARRPSKKSKKGVSAKRTKNEPVIEQRQNLDIQEELKRSQCDILDEKSGQNKIAASSHHTSGEILLPTIYTSTQNQSPRIQSSPPSSSSRQLKAQNKKKESEKSMKQNEKISIELLKASPRDRYNSKYLYQQLDAQHKTQQDIKREERDHKKQELLQKIEQISNEIKVKTDVSPKPPQSSLFLTQSFSYQNLRKNISKDRKFKSKVGQSLIAHTQTSRAKIASREEKKKPIVPRIRGMKVDTDIDSKFALHSSYNSAPSSARSRVVNKKIPARGGGVNYFHNKSTLNKRSDGNLKISHRQLLSPELIQNLTLQTSIYREDQSAPQVVLEPNFNQRTMKRATPSSSSICTPRTITSTKISKKYPAVITKVKKIQEFSSRPVNLTTKVQETISPSANSLTATKYTNNLYSSNSSVTLKQKSRSTPKLQTYKYQQNAHISEQQPQNPRNINTNQSMSNYRNRQPMQGKVTITTTQTTTSTTQRPQTTRNSTSKTSSYSKLFSGVRRSQDDDLRNQTKDRGIAQRQILIEQESKNEIQGSGKILKKKWLSKQMQREKQKMAKSYHHIISTSSGLSSKSLTAYEWNRLKGVKPVQVIYEATQQSI